MATFKITEKTTVAELKTAFGNEVGGTLRIYEGRSEASDDATLVSLGAKEGELECRTNRTVGKFEEAFKDELNLKVKVYTNDNWVKVLDGITLATVKNIPNQTTKTKMEEFLAYERKGTKEVTETVEVTETEDTSVLPTKQLPETDAYYAIYFVLPENTTPIDMEEQEKIEEDDRGDMYYPYRYMRDGEYVYGLSFRSVFRIAEYEEVNVEDLELYDAEEPNSYVQPAKNYPNGGVGVYVNERLYNLYYKDCSRLDYICGDTDEYLPVTVAVGQCSEGEGEWLFDNYETCHCFIISHEGEVLKEWYLE